MSDELSTKIDQLLEHTEAQIDAISDLKDALNRLADWYEAQAKGGSDV